MRGVRRRWIAACAASAAGVLAWSAVCYRFVGHPGIDSRMPVDAMYVIGPAETRWTEGLAVAGTGVAPVVLVTQTLAGGTEIFPPECSGQSPATPTGQGYRIICVIPDPYTTRGEARALADQVRQNGWTHVAVFTSTPHVARTRMLMERCVPAQVSVWDYPHPRSVVEWVGDAVYQSLAWVKAQVVRSC